jgi:hypothetical protein
MRRRFSHIPFSPARLPVFRARPILEISGAAIENAAEESARLREEYAQV